MTEENTQPNKSERALQDPAVAEKSAMARQEEATLAFWKEQNIFEKTTQKDAPNGEFVFYDGPPTANGMPGLHHVEPQSFKDAIPRYKTMQGFRVPRRAGWDTHGLPVELQVEKELGLKSKKEIESYGVAEFNKRCKESVWKYKAEWMKMRTRMGYWTDMEHAYITYSNNYIEALWGVVGKANNNGYLYKDFKVVPWCPRCGTGLSSHELNQPGAYKDVKDLSVYVKFKVVGQENTYILAWTTTPWTLPGNVALAVGKDIEYVKYERKAEPGVYLIASKDFFSKQHGNVEVKEPASGLTKDIVFEEEFTVLEMLNGDKLAGLAYEPLYPYLGQLDEGDEKLQNAFKIYEADFVTTTDGTGVVHTAVMYGADDFDLGTKVGLPKFHLVNEEGKFVAGTDFLEGRYVKESDENGKPTLAVDIINDLKTRGLFFNQENIKHSYPHCWRCDTPLVYYARSSWYFRMSSLREKLLSANEQINWEPDHVKAGRFGEWLDGIKDWAISRDRYWGTPLPVWTTEDGEIEVVDSIEKLKSLIKTSGNNYFVMRHGQTNHNLEGVWSCDSHLPDPLTEEGKRQVEETAKSLADKKIDLIICSPFPRTQQTAHEVAEALGIDKETIIADKRLGEWNIGKEYDQRPFADFFAVRNASNAQRYQFKTADGESYAEVFQRVGNFLYDIEENYQGKNILIISHGAPCRSLVNISEGISFNELYENTRDFNDFANAQVRSISFCPIPHDEMFNLDLHKPYIDQVELYKDGKKLTRTKEVMDVWFDSGAMPYAQDHDLGSPMNFSPKPADYISEGLDQTRGWFYTLHAVSNMISPEPRAAYRNVICLGLILDANGQKMSKSKGNVTDPWEMFAKYGADSIRFWMYSVNQPGDSKNFDEKTVAEINNKVFNLFGNVLSFYELYRDVSLEGRAVESRHVLDQWVMARLNQLVEDMTIALDGYDLFKPTRAVREFIDDLSTWYLRRSRDRIKDGDVDAKGTLYTVLKTTAQLMAPFAPFFAEYVWQKLKTEADEESAHLSMWPGSNSIDSEIINNMQITRNFCTAGNAFRKSKNLPIRQPLKLMKISYDGLSKELLLLIEEELNIKMVIVDTEIQPAGEIYIDEEITLELKLEGEYRELVRLIQDIRKEKGLAPSDVISLTLPERYKEIVDGFGEELKKTVGAKEVTIDGEEVIIN